MVILDIAGGKSLHHDRLLDEVSTSEEVEFHEEFDVLDDAFEVFGRYRVEVTSKLIRQQDWISAHMIRDLSSESFYELEWPQKEESF